jgi:cytochrome c peroxidase
VPQGQPADPTGEAPQQLYTDFRYHHIGVPFNREIPGVAKGEKTGLTAHVTNIEPGTFKTPTLRNVAKGLSATFTKAYTHNGWFKSLESLVHFYNTRDVLTKCEALTPPILNATEKEALQNNCWPAPEFPNPPRVIGNLTLTPEEEAALVAYLKTLTDQHTPTTP